MTQESDGSWICTGVEEGGQPATLKYARDSITFTYAYEVLEAYYVGSTCSMYPPQPEGVTFSATGASFDGKDVSQSVQWETFSCPSGPGCAGSAECGEKATVSGTDVTISYQTG